MIVLDRIRINFTMRCAVEFKSNLIESQCTHVHIVILITYFLLTYECLATVKNMWIHTSACNSCRTSIPKLLPNKISRNKVCDYSSKQCNVHEYFTPI